jgi:hypothetical protein
MNNTDFYGLWSTGGHNELIDRAFPDLSEAARRGVKVGSKYADSYVAGHQDGSMAFMHAMSSPQLSKRESCEKMREFVNKQLELFQRKSKAAKKEPRVGDPYIHLGMALHAIMDSTSPAHRGFALWSIKFTNEHGDFPGSLEDLEAVNTYPAHANSAITQMRSAYESGTFSQDCSC